MKIGGIQSEKYDKDEQNYAGLCNYSSRAVTRLTVYRAIEVGWPRGGNSLVIFVDTFDECASKVQWSRAEAFSEIGKHMEL